MNGEKLNIFGTYLRALEAVLANRKTPPVQKTQLLLLQLLPLVGQNVVRQALAVLVTRGRTADAVPDPPPLPPDVEEEQNGA